MTVLLTGCAACSSESPSAERIERRVDAIERSLERTRAHFMRTKWTRQLQRDVDEAPPAGAMLLPHSLPDLADWRSRELPGDLPQRVELLHRHALLAVVASEPRVRALETQLAAGAGELRPAELRELARERNASARRLGFRDFYTLWLAAQGTSPKRVGERFAVVESATRGAARSLPPGPAETADDAFRPLDAALAGGAPVEVGVRSIRLLGLELDSGRVRIERLEDGRRSAAAAAYPVEIPGDVRILVPGREGHVAQREVLHELGHALFYSHARTGPYPLRLPANRFISEGFAKFFERLIYEKEWLRGEADLAEPEVAAIRRAVARAELLRARELLGRRHFEQALYADDPRELDVIFRESMEELTEGDWSGRESEWTRLSQLVTQPFSSDEYLHARFVQSQLRRHLGSSSQDGMLTKSAGDFLIRTVVEPGATLGADELMRRATGAPIDPRAYLEDELGLKDLGLASD